ncbi:protein POST-ILLUMINATION CHLOROPHYLL FLUORESCENCE INCREASE, chloroplastic [Physcomitrium patens]|uniref:PIFI-like Ig-like domain-containing protein n=1 Tax=Physcomitrium patens TaxID=3218 RepID=A9TMI0_PHYPA|nr:uncharacterized protein LOC112275394 [Physcomitrium patens]PNR30311.1 hypothetical protein PHYPA_026627 [Physcomitrium patens]|eukprot:XP_024361524.1 uncharacterized protein LOC112275394 [Physcomitrella patens]
MAIPSLSFAGCCASTATPSPVLRTTAAAATRCEPVAQLSACGEAAPSLASRFYGSRLTAKCDGVLSKRVKRTAGKVLAIATVGKDVKQYSLPSWANFEMGYYPVYWETATGLPPTSGQLLTIIFNAAASNLVPNENFGIAFNGSFNQPIMCGGEPRVMAKKERGSLCEPLYSIKINVPLHATSLEFSFTDGSNWDGPYNLIMDLPDKLKGLPQSYFNERLGKDLAKEGACDSAIYPEVVFTQDRCAFPAGMIQEGGDRCDLDIVPGCTDPESPYFDPLANVDDGSCPLEL